ncbi:TorF family putative porin [uncultured Aquabacterium sp.]|uniref:TorF family putative porin n=1 Tax=uncultured Aquabacterium sp. TaxID=158753 RepID=UPI0026238A0B|nr:TorF family putative porin [uncultured Aquabacterium sp.]
MALSSTPRLTRVAAACALALPLLAGAETAPYTLTTNVALVSEYVFRGMTYSQGRAAVQGGADFAHQSGLYLGVWASSVSGEPLGGAVSEVDYYGGYTASAGDFTYDVGLLQFTFPRGKLTNNVSLNTLEAYGSITWKMLNLKYSRTIGDYFGVNEKSGYRADSKGSDYIEANINYEFLPGWTANLHAGRQSVKGSSEYNFSDYKVGVSRDLGAGWLASLAWIDTTGDTVLYTYPSGVNVAAAKWVASIKRTF